MKKWVMEELLVRTKVAIRHSGWVQDAHSVGCGTTESTILDFMRYEDWHCNLSFTPINAITPRCICEHDCQPGE